MKSLSSYAGIAGTAMGIAACSAGISYALREAIKTLWRWRTSEANVATGILCPTCGRYADPTRMAAIERSMFMAGPEPNLVLQNPEWSKRTYRNMKVGDA